MSPCALLHLAPAHCDSGSHFYWKCDIPLHIQHLYKYTIISAYLDPTVGILLWEDRQEAGRKYCWDLQQAMICLYIKKDLKVEDRSK